MRTTRIITNAVLAATIAAFAVQASAGILDLSWYTFDGGGGTSAAGAYLVSGTIAQPDAVVMSGGDYELVGGFWGAAQAPVCGTTPSCDVNCDGSVNGFDIQPFVLLLNGMELPCSPCAGDVNGDGSLNGQDIQPFRDALIAGGCE